MWWKPPCQKYTTVNGRTTNQFRIRERETRKWDVKKAENVAEENANEQDEIMGNVGCSRRSCDMDCQNNLRNRYLTGSKRLS